MLGDLRILDTGDELLLDTERIALQELFNMIRRFSIGYDVQLHKRTLERGLRLADRPRRLTPWPGARDLPATEHAHIAGPDRPASRPARSGPTWASTCCARPTDTTELIAGARARAAPMPVSEAAAECVRDRARPAPLRHRPR